MKIIITALLALLLTASASAQNVGLGSKNTVTKDSGVITFAGSTFCLKDPSDTDKACINAPALAGNIVITTPAITSTLATLDGTETLTNKSIVATQLTGTIAAGRMPALTGDITTSAGAVATTLATVNSNVGSFGSATKASVFMVNAKGLVTAASESTVTPAVGSITGLGTGVATWLATPTGANLVSVLGCSGTTNFLRADGACSPLATVAVSGSASDLGTGTLPAGRLPALTGDVTTSAGSAATTIANNAVTLDKMAQVATARFIGRTTAGTGDPEALTGTQATALLDAFVGDSGSGGTKGLVPAPGAGSAALSKFLKADGTFAVPSTAGGAGAGTVTTLEECTYAGLGTETYSNGQSKSLCGRTHDFTIDVNGTAAMVAAGLKFTGTSSSSAQQRYVNIGNVIGSIVGAARFLRGNWQFWTHKASYTYTSATAATTFERVSGSYANNGIDARRAKNINGGANTSAGSVVMMYGFQGVETAGPNIVNAGDVFMIYARSPFSFELYVGTYSAGWPAMESMTFVASVYVGQTPTGTTPHYANAYWTDPASWGVLLGLYSSNAADVTFARWRVTTYE